MANEINPTIHQETSKRPKGEFCSPTLAQTSSERSSSMSLANSALKRDETLGLEVTCDSQM